VQGEHVHRGEPFPQGVLAAQLGQPRQQFMVAPQVKPDSQGLLDRVPVQFVEVGAQPLPQPVGGRVVQRRATPQGEGLAQ